jgi:hypothetical protein
MCTQRFEWNFVLIAIYFLSSSGPPMVQFGPAKGRISVCKCVSIWTVCPTHSFECKTKPKSQRMNPIIGKQRPELSLYAKPFVVYFSKNLLTVGVYIDFLSLTNAKQFSPLINGQHTCHICVYFRPRGQKIGILARKNKAKCSAVWRLGVKSYFEDEWVINHHVMQVVCCARLLLRWFLGG